MKNNLFYLTLVLLLGAREDVQCPSGCSGPQYQHQTI